MTEPTPQVVLVDFEAVTEVDATALITIRDLIEELERAGIDLRLARVRTHVLDLMRTTGLDDLIGHEHIYDSVHAGADAFLAEPGKDEGKNESTDKYLRNGQNDSQWLFSSWLQALLFACIACSPLAVSDEEEAAEELEPP